MNALPEPEGVVNRAVRRERTKKESKVITDYNLPARADVLEVEKYLGESLKVEIFVEELLPLTVQLSRKQLDYEVQGSLACLEDLIQASASFQHSPLARAFEQTALLVVIKAHHQIIKPLERVDLVYLKRILNLSSADDLYYFEGGILVR